MNNQQILQSASGLLESVRVIRNWRAMALLAVTLFASALTLTALMATQIGLLAFLGVVLGTLMLFYGLNAVGILLMADTRQVRLSPLEALMQSLLSSHRVIGIAILAVLGLLALLAVVAIALFICKIPFIGPLLYVFVLPASALALGVAIFALFAIYLPLAACAVWNGSKTLQAMGTLFALTRQRLVQIVCLELLLAILVGIAAIIISNILLPGYLTTIGLSGAILGGNAAAFMHHGGSGLGFAPANPYIITGGVGTALLFATAFVTPWLITIQGLCHIYLRELANLDQTRAGQDIASASKTLGGLAERAEKLAETAAAKAREASLNAKEKIASARNPAAAAPDAAEAPENAPTATNPDADSAAATAAAPPPAQETPEQQQAARPDKNTPEA
ncbi:MAG: hypothetical protein LBP52_00705 [Burkholderiaceae bacterium]|jgi:hypothetical protein|nr:hypothetical protein [Burkholderiaceae bacterium]